MTQITGNQSGRQIGAANLQKFIDWIAERDRAADWHEYIHQDMLNRSEIALQCGFALSVIRQNPAVKEALKELEDRLRDQGTLRHLGDLPGPSTEAPATATDLALDRRIMAAKAKAERRVKVLEEQLATARAETRELRDKLRHFEYLDEHLTRTMRSPYP